MARNPASASAFMDRAAWTALTPSLLPIVAWLILTMPSPWERAWASTSSAA